MHYGIVLIFFEQLWFFVSVDRVNSEFRIYREILSHQYEFVLRVIKVTPWIQIVTLRLLFSIYETLEETLIFILYLSTNPIIDDHVIIYLRVNSWIVIARKSFFHQVKLSIIFLFFFLFFILRLLIESYETFKWLHYMNY